MNLSYGGVLIHNKKVLLREPTNHFGGYHWTFAKGQRDTGETEKAAALREVLEETGYRARITGSLPSSFRGTTSVVKMFIMQPIGNQGNYHWETSATKWVGYEEAKKLISKTIVKEGRDRDLAILESVKSLLT